jgi:hypothetical protein
MGLGALSAISSAEAAAERADLSTVRIKDVEILQITGKNKRRVLYLKIDTDAGVAGLYGPIETTRRPCSSIVSFGDTWSVRTLWRTKPSGTRCSARVAIPGAATI